MLSSKIPRILNPAITFPHHKSGRASSFILWVFLHRRSENRTIQEGGDGRERAKGVMRSMGGTGLKGRYKGGTWGRRDTGRGRGMKKGVCRIRKGEEGWRRWGRGRDRAEGEGRSWRGQKRGREIGQKERVGHEGGRRIGREIGREGGG